ncbi:MAG: protein-disulfide reductase DsbD family protein [Rhodospirillaceae bacterium]
MSKHRFGRALLRGVAVVALVAGPASLARGQAAIETEQLAVRLVAEQATVRPGDRIAVAIHQKIAAGWHTYWMNPGDSGQATAIDWRLPDGAAASDLQWPAPRRFAYGPMANYGYAGAVALLADIAVPADWPAGRPFPVAGEAEVLVCAEICIPVAGTLSLEVPTGPQTAAAPGAAALFADARAAMPRPLPWTVAREAAGDALRLAVGGEGASAATDAYFFAEEWGVVDHPGAQVLRRDAAGFTLSLPRGQAPAPATLAGVLAVTERTAAGPVQRAYAVPAGPVAAAAPAGPAASAAASAAAPADGLAALLAFAFLGGMILNLMPCVFPVLAVKAIGFARGGDTAARARLGDGLSYGAGVVASFVALAAALLAVRAGGAAVGWGFQLQSPAVVAALAFVMTAIGLNLSGVFEFGSRLAGLGSGWANRPGHGGAFATGVLAAVVAAPCTAPFMATAAGGALLLPAPSALAVFAAMGLGLAAPYVVLTAVPALARRMPRPGAWMVRFRQALAFPMYATAAWLVWVLAQQAGPDAAFLATLGLIALAAALWLWPAVSPRAGRGAALRAGGFAVALAGSGALLATAATLPPPSGRAVEASPDAQPYSAAGLDRLRGEGRAVFVNMTAAWCITCKVNERVALSGPDFAATLQRHAVTYMQGDWTRRDPEITAFLERFDRAGVPLYVLYPAGGGAPRLLPQILDPGALRRALETAS